eukprot:SAG11_NODE_2538_length_3243_cov_1.535623_2_plen_86_part_00
MGEAWRRRKHSASHSRDAPGAPPAAPLGIVLNLAAEAPCNCCFRAAMLAAFLAWYSGSACCARRTIRYRKLEKIWIDAAVRKKTL